MKRALQALLVALAAVGFVAAIAGAGQSFPGLTQVTHDSTINGTGTVSSPLSVVNGSSMVTGTVTSPDLVVASGAHSVANYAGTSCSPGNAIGSLDATGTATCVSTGGAGLDPMSFAPIQDGVFTTGGAQQNDYNPASLKTNTIIQVQAGDNTGTLLTGLDAIDNGASTTIASGSNGASLPQATINVANTSGFAAYLGNYVIYVTTGAGQQTVTCTGTTGTTFTGCSGGSGSMSTGGSVLGGLAVGTFRILCNLHAPADDGVLALSNEDTSSQPNNRILLPGGGKYTSTNEDRFGMGGSQCMPLVYMQPDQATPSARRWILVGTHGRGGRITAQMLELFPWTQPAALTSGANANNWNPTDTCPQVSGGAGGSCEAGASKQFADYSMVIATTSTSSNATITGMVGPGGNSGKGEGFVKCIENAGPGPITFTNADSNSTSTNQFNLPNAASVVMRPNDIRCFWTNGSSWVLIGSALSSASLTTNVIPKATDINTLGPSAITDNGTGTTIGAVAVADSATQNTATFLAVQPSGTGLTSNAGVDIGITDNRTFNTTGGGISINGISSVLGATRSAGSNNLTNVSIIAQATGGQVNYSWQSVGDEYHGLGGAINNFLINMASGHYVDSGDSLKVEKTLYVGGGDFTSTTHQEIAQGQVVPTVNHGTLSADSSNFVGDVSSIGANTSVTLTFGGGGFGTTSHCMVTVEGSATVGIQVSTVSATAPVFSCFTLASGAAANCPNFTYQCWGH